VLLLALTRMLVWWLLMLMLMVVQRAGVAR
jgi:hypothetical protein